MVQLSTLVLRTTGEARGTIGTRPPLLTAQVNRPGRTPLVLFQHRHQGARKSTSELGADTKTDATQRDKQGILPATLDANAEAAPRPLSRRTEANACFPVLGGWSRGLVWSPGLDDVPKGGWIVESFGSAEIQHLIWRCS